MGEEQEKKLKLKKKRRRRIKARRREGSNFLKTCPGKERAELRSYSSGESESGDAAPDRRLLPSLSPSPASLPPFFPPSPSVFFRTLSVPLGPCSRQHLPPPCPRRCSRARRPAGAARSSARRLRTGAAAARAPSLPAAGEAPYPHGPPPRPPSRPAWSLEAPLTPPPQRRSTRRDGAAPAAAPGGSFSAGHSRQLRAEHGNFPLSPGRVKSRIALSLSSQASKQARRIYYVVLPHPKSAPITLLR